MTSKADRDWWDEVDSAIRADEVGDSSDSTAFIVDEPGISVSLVCFGIQGTRNA